ncbi:undecaprenyl-diphosphatase [Verrucomicrobium sp. GAS474]|uniref:phosphatase PAP2 family protein n=1 Tax=Verrucomicrobium sp. GAS474 TaxID=1882831 RepID=UPI00087B5D3B|nr:phosphatase PAP2 family protein [Verrucomicrobium sp. GAS474]SDT88007.1 undecaprenyl-diphosphatase [Verrucomicrobium sp. GAS474]
MRSLRALLSDGRALIATAWERRGGIPAETRIVAAILFVLVFSTAFALDFHVARLISALGEAAPGLRPVAEKFSFWGDYLTGTFIVSFSLIFAGIGFDKAAWRRAGLAALLAASLAGIPGSTLRLTLGRPRPAAEEADAVARLHLDQAPEPFLSFHRRLRPEALPDGFYGPRPTSLMQGFPSGHATTSMATAGALLIAYPPLGIPAMAAAAGVCWSRAWLGRHYLSDLLAGTVLGLGVGLPLGAAARRLGRSGR